MSGRKLVVQFPCGICGARLYIDITRTKTTESGRPCVVRERVCKTPGCKFRLITREVEVRGRSKAEELIRRTAR